MLTTSIAWIDTYEEGDERLSRFRPTDRLLPPSPIHSATHNHTPTTPERRKSQDGFVDDFEDTKLQPKRQETKIFGGKRMPVKGRKWDHARDKAPVILQAQYGAPSDGPEWRTYIKASQYGPALAEDGKQVDDAFLQEQTPGYANPWRGDIEDDEDPEKNGNIFRNKKKQRSMINQLQVSENLSCCRSLKLTCIAQPSGVTLCSFRPTIYRLRHFTASSWTLCFCLSALQHIPVFSESIYNHGCGC